MARMKAGARKKAMKRAQRHANDAALELWTQLKRARPKPAALRALAGAQEGRDSLAGAAEDASLFSANENYGVGAVADGDSSDAGASMR